MSQPSLSGGPILVIAGLSEVRDAYDLLLCDVWGVIHNGRDAFAGPCEALARWRRERGPVVLVSNSPRPSTDVTGQLEGFGVPREAWSELVTSGDVTRDLLAARAPGPALRIGPDRDAPLFEGLGLGFADVDRAAFIACTGLADDETEHPEDYRALLTDAAGRGLEMVCANPDRVVQRGERLIPCAGALADLYEAVGGRVLMAGKPFGPIYDLALARGAALLGRRLDKRRVLAVGDGPTTDIAGAHGQGLDTLFVASGIHGASTDSGGLEVAALGALWPKGVPAPTFAMGALSW